MPIIDLPRHHPRRLILYSGEVPAQNLIDALAILGYQVAAIDSVDLSSLQALAGIDSVILSQRPDKPTAIHRDLERHAQRWLDYDCRIYVRVANSPILQARSRTLVVNTLKALGLPAGPLTPLEREQVIPERREREGLPLAPFVYICDIAVGWPELANIIAHNPAGYAPGVNVVIGGTNAEHQPLQLSLSEELLVRRAFGNCKSVHLNQMEDGLSGVKAFRAYSQSAAGLQGPWPTVHFVKIGNRQKIAREYEKYLGDALLYIPFHLRPRLDVTRCGLGADVGILVGDFVEEAEPIRDCACAGRAVPAIANLFNKTLYAWHHALANDDPRPIPELLATRFPVSIPAHRRELIRETQANLDLDHLRTLFMRHTQGPVRVGVIHGDLHATNVLVRATDAILIDFDRVEHAMPLLYDAASLEGGLLVDGFRRDPRPQREWLESILPLYEGQILKTRPRYHPQDASAWFYACVRQIRLHARELECARGQYAAVLALCLLSKGCNDHEFHDPRQQTRAAAYFLGEKLLMTLEKPAS